MTFNINIRQYMFLKCMYETLSFCYYSLNFCSEGTAAEGGQLLIPSDVMGMTSQDQAALQVQNESSNILPTHKS